MHVHLRFHHWVLWWFCVGVACGVVAILNILLRDLTRTQDRIILLVGVMNWVLGGLVCWAFEGIQIRKPPQPPGPAEERRPGPEIEWHPASEFVLPGSGKSLLPLKYPPKKSRRLLELQSSSTPAQEPF